MGVRQLVRAGQLVGLVTATASMVVLGALPASAAPPTHDTITSAKVITEVPFSETVDTTEATTDEEDAAVNTNCGAPATNGSVWYSIEASAPAYIVDVSQSDFAAGVIVATGTPGNLSLLACGPGSVGFPTTAGETYYVMAFSDDPAVVGGQLVINVTAGEPPPEVSMTVDDVGQVNTETGTATLSGTYTCTGTADLTLVQGRLSQQQGDVHVVGEFDRSDLTCGGTFPWSAEVLPGSGKFEPGLAATIALTAGCNQLGCNTYETLEVVRLEGGGQG
jgi:Family of unknown function (DUF6299)